MPIDRAALSPAILDAIERLERETGRPLDDILPHEMEDEPDEAILEFLLAVSGFPVERRERS